MKRLRYRWLGTWTAIGVLLPGMALAAGDKTTNIVVVADTRRLTGVMHYFADLYNSNITMFAVWLPWAARWVF